MLKWEVVMLSFEIGTEIFDFRDIVIFETKVGHLRTENLDQFVVLAFVAFLRLFVVNLLAASLF